MDALKRMYEICREGGCEDWPICQGKWDDTCAHWIAAYNELAMQPLRDAGLTHLIPVVATTKGKGDD